VSLPGADELFGPTPVIGPAPVPDADDPDAPVSAEAAQRAPAGGSGRVRHDEKMTVYVTADELFEIESARLDLRRRHGVAVDRGRLVREAVALCLADLEVNGADSALARRLASA
jgi:hypothetical protein